MRTRELRDSNKQLESFCYTIAHDLRGPLRAMAGFGAILQQRYALKLGPTGADYTHRIIGGAKHMDTLIHDLLEYGRFNTVEFVPTRIDAEEVLNRVVENLQPAIAETRANIERRGRLPSVMGHGVALEAALSNLITNALKFVPPKTPPKVTIWTEDHDNAVSILIADNGIGIPLQNQGKIFQVFERLHSQKDYPGTGIGLAIVSKAVQRMGGQVGVESHPGKGSRFWINLPRAPK
jgi:signal transduction histidine kinase